MTWLAMKVVCTCQRMAARQRISRMGTGQASASTQIGMRFSLVGGLGQSLTAVVILAIDQGNIIALMVYNRALIQLTGNDNVPASSLSEMQFRVYLRRRSQPCLPGMRS